MSARKPRHRSGPAFAREFRQFSADGLEVRSSGADVPKDTIQLAGFPIVYGQGYSVRDAFGEFEETMQPGVASDVLAGGNADIRFLFNHDGLPLARSTSGTLTLRDEATRLGFIANLDARQSLANDLAVAVERGDVNQMSCGFVVGDDNWSDDYMQRSVNKFQQLFDVSAVTYPASPTTSIEIAQRMMLGAPIESRSRVRKLWAISRDLRSGKSLDDDAVEFMQTAFASLHDADEDLDLEAALRSRNPDDGRTQSEEGREAPTTRETRDSTTEDSISFSDLRGQVQAALETQLGTTNAFITDLSDDWVVFEILDPEDMNPGMWKIDYTNTDGTVTFGDEPAAVTQSTTYVPVPADEEPPAATGDVPAERSAAFSLEADLVSFGIPIEVRAAWGKDLHPGGRSNPSKLGASSNQLHHEAISSGERAAESAQIAQKPATAAKNLPLWAAHADKKKLGNIADKDAIKAAGAHNKAGEQILGTRTLAKSGRDSLMSPWEKSPENDQKAALASAHFDAADAWQKIGDGGGSYDHDAMFAKYGAIDDAAKKMK